MIPREKIDPELQELKDDKGEFIREFYFNKGL
jgi:hypothetical protein